MARKQQLKRPGALQERCCGQEAAVVATWSVTRSVAVAKTQLKKIGLLCFEGLGLGAGGREYVLLFIDFMRNISKSQMFLYIGDLIAPAAEYM